MTITTKLTNCQTCNKEISRNAKTCPSCGEKNPHGKKSMILFLFVVFLGISIFAQVLQGINNAMRPNSSSSDTQIAASQNTPPLTPQEQSLKIKSLDACKQEIAKFFGATGASQIPDSKDFSSGNEFEFAWPRGTFQLATPAGSIDLSASCNVRKKPFKVMWLTINGKTIIQNGQR